MTTPGLIVAPLTPFTPELAVDGPALQRQIDYVVKDCGATMVVAAGVEIYTVVGARVGLFKGIGYPDFPCESANSRGGRMER